MTWDEYVNLVRSLIERETLSETANRYVPNLSKRAALLRSEPAAVLRSDPAFVALEKEIRRLADRIDDQHVDDPLVSRMFPDGGPRDDAVGSED